MLFELFTMSLKMWAGYGLDVWHGLVLVGPIIPSNQVGQGRRRAITIIKGSVRISQAYVLHWVPTCIDHGERKNGSDTVSGLVFEHR